MSLTTDFDDFVTTIKCRFYDITDPLVPVFSIKEFTMAEIFISGLWNYLERPEATYTSHLDLYLIDIQATSLSSEPVYKCIKYWDDLRMYDPLEPFPISEVPPTTDLNWEVYTLIDHMCGQVSLKDEYYKVIISTSFPYTYVADLWGDRCFKNDQTISKLRLDEWGNANACIKADDENQKEYIAWDFKNYNWQKDQKKSALLIPKLKRAVRFNNAGTVPDMALRHNSGDDFYCNSAGNNNFKLDIETGMCVDSTQP